MCGGQLFEQSPFEPSRAEMDHQQQDGHRNPADIHQVVQGHGFVPVGSIEDRRRLARGALPPGLGAYALHVCMYVLW